MKDRYDSAKNFGVMHCCTSTNGCTVLGFATDLAIHRCADDEINPRPIRKKQYELFFTEEGFKQDVKFVKKLMAKLPDSQ